MQCVLLLMFPPIATQIFSRNMFIKKGERSIGNNINAHTDLQFILKNKTKCEISQ